LAIVALKNAREKSRDTRRKADLKQIRTALDLYYDANGRYPQAGTCAYGSNCYVYSTAGSSWISALVNGGYMSKVPIDPTNNANGPWSSTSNNYSYAYGNVSTNGQVFDLTARLENTSDPDRCAVKCYKFYFNNQPWCPGSGCGGSYSNQIYENSP
jgi:type II secretory pathway pseudopilin PulG